MLNIQNVSAVYLACGTTDLRKAVDGLAVIVQEQFKLDPFSSYLFVFCNKNRDKLKILHWEYNGFWLYYRRLERGKFKWPKVNNEPLKIDLKEFSFLLDGYEVRCGKVFKEVTQRSVI